MVLAQLVDGGEKVLECKPKERERRMRWDQAGLLVAFEVRGLQAHVFSSST